MRCTVCLALLTAVMVSACNRSTPEQQAVNDAAEALGGSDRIQAVKTIVIEGEGTQGNLGQDVRPDATGQTFTVSGYRRAIDLAGGRARTELTRAPNFQYFAGQAPQKIVQGLDGDVGYNVAANGTATRTPDPVANDRRAEIYHHPITSVRAALDPGATLTNPRMENGQNLVDVRTASGVTFTLAVDSGSMLPARVISTLDNTNLGDVVVETTFADYQDVNGLQLPATADHEDRRCDDGGRARDQAGGRRARQATSRRRPPRHQRAPMAGPPPATVAVEELAPRVWLLGRTEPPQRARGVRRSPDADRGAAERHARAGRHREGARAAAGQAADAARRVAPSLRSLGRRPRRDVGRAHRHRARERGRVPRGSAASGRTPSIPDALAKNPRAVNVEGGGR